MWEATICCRHPPVETTGTKCSNISAVKVGEMAVGFWARTEGMNSPDSSEGNNIL